MARVLVALALASFLLFARPLLAVPGPPPGDEVELEPRLQGLLSSRRVAGMGVVLADRGGVRWASGIGKSDVRTGVDATHDTLFRVASISKIWVALSVLKLESEGRLSLDATVRALAPGLEFENPWEAEDPVRVVHLLENTTGWDDIGFRELAHDDPRPATLSEGLALGARSRTSRWRPGTRYSYCNHGPAVAAWIIEKVTGKRYEDHVAETFFEPLGMESASFFLTPETERRLTRLYRGDGRTEYPYWHVPLRPAAALNASAREMGKLLLLLLNRGSVGQVRLLPAAALERMESAETPPGARAGLRTGYGLHNFVLQDGGFIWHGHTGGIDGASSELFYLPGEGVGYFYSMNGDDEVASEAIGKLLRAHLTRDLKRPELPPAAEAGPHAEGYSGWYENVNPRRERERFFLRIFGLTRVRSGGPGLLVTALLGKARGDYAAVSPTLFRRPGEQAPTLALLPPGPDGQMIEVSGITLRAVPSWVAWAQMATTALALGSMGSVPLLALVWIPRKLLGRMRDVKHLGARVWPLGAVLAFALAAALYALSDSAQLGRLTLASAALTTSTLLFAFLSAASLLAIGRVPRREMSPWIYLHTWLASASLCSVAIYLSFWGIIGIRTWV